ncbi:MAG: hypothetical protein M1828_007279 [Chrysothrix sp. TS-e1954]|nr:MAG: hypothetical protein M1828_007279 [Chrysothrix sp. TS-e1954]
MQNGEKAQDKTGRKKPFASWMKKLAGLKSSSGSKSGSRKGRNGSPAKAEPARQDTPATNEEPTVPDEAPQLDRIPNDRIDPNTFDAPPTQQNGSINSFPTADESQATPDVSNKSAAPTLATNPDTVNSDGGVSKTNTSATANGAHSTLSGGGENSVFSSSNHSSRSLTTTLTTIQSAAPSGQLNQFGTPTQPTHASNPSQGSTSVYFTHQYPTTPASAVPTHLQPAVAAQGPQTYRSATANNLLSDNASIVTLASSSQHNRRRASVDTNASVRAIAPSSQWGGSRESLPLSTLSQTTESATPTQNPPRPSISGLPAAERASVYSSSGVTAPALSSERNSVYTGRAAADGSSLKLADAASLRAGDASSMRSPEAASLRGTTHDGSSTRGTAYDGASVRSGKLGHGRSDSVGGSVSGLANSPVTSPTDHGSHE